VNVDSVVIVDEDDPRVRDFLGLTDMDLRQRMEPERGIFMAEGHLVIDRCAQARMQFLAVLTTERWLDRLESMLADVDVTVYVAPEHLMQRITGYRVHRGALATVRRPAERSVTDVLASGSDVLVLEDLVDPTNVGLAIRSAVVQGVRDIILSPGCADPLYRKAVKSSMGTVLRGRWARSQDWPSDLDLLARSRRMIALTPEGTVDLSEALTETAGGPVALAFGSEGPGLSAPALRAAWRRCSIPMAHPEDSLNVAAAVAVACFARSRSMPA